MIESNRALDPGRASTDLRREGMDEAPSLCPYTETTVMKSYIIYDFDVPFFILANLSNIPRIDFFVIKKRIYMKIL